MYSRRRLLPIYIIILLGVTTVVGWGEAQTIVSPNPPQPELPLQPQLDLRMGHGGTVESVALSADGGLVASQADDGTVKLWDATTGWLRRSLNISTRARAVALSPDGLVVACAADQAVRRWDARIGAALPPLTGPVRPIDVVAFSPDGKIVAGAGDDQWVWLWDAQTGTLLRTLKGHNGPVQRLSFSADSGTLCSMATHVVKRGDLNVNARLLSPDELQHLNIKTGVLVTGLDPAGLEAKSGVAINDVLYQLNGKEFASLAGWNEEAHKHEPGEYVSLSVLRAGQPLEIKVRLSEIALSVGEVRMWDVTTGVMTQPRKEITDVWNEVALAPNGKALVTNSSGNVLRLWDAQTGALVRTLTGSDYAVYRVAFSPDGKTVAGVIGTTIFLWDAQTGTVRRTLTGHNTVVLSIAFSGDGKTLASGGVDKTVRLWDTDTGAQKQMLGRDATVFSLALAADGQTLAGANGERAVLLWDVHSGELKRSLPHAGIVYAAEYAPAGKLLASAGGDGLIKIWDAPTGTWLRTLPGGSGVVRQLAFAPDGEVLASAYDDATVKLWNPQTGALLRTLRGHQRPVMTLAFAPDGKSLVSGSMDGTLKFWNPRTGDLTRTLPGHSPAPQTAKSVAFSPDGKRFAAWSSGRIINIWDAQTEALEQTIKLEGASEFIGCLTFSPDSKSLVAGTYRRVYVWDAQSVTLQRTLVGHSGWVWSLRFVRGSQILASGGEDQIKLWDISSKWGGKGRELATLYALAPPSGAKALTADARALTADGRPVAADPLEVPTSSDYLVTTPEGYYMGSAAADRYVHFRLGNDSFPAESFQARYYRPDLVRQALAGQELPPVGAFKGPVPPLLTFTAPKNESMVSGNITNVSVEASDDSDIKSVAFFVNGRRVEAKPITADARPLTADAKALTADGRDIPAAHRLARRFTVALPLPRDDSNIKVQAIAFDDDGLQSPREEILFTRDKTVAVTGKLLGLCVGVSHYQDPRLNLHYADADATALAAALNQQRGLYSTAQVTALTNEQATQAAVKAALDKLIAQTTPNDTVLLLLSGHGWRGDERSFYFATYEVNRNAVAATALSWQDVVDRLTQLSRKSKRVIVLLDACHSGSAATNEELVKAVLSANAGVMVFASSRGSEVSLELRQQQHGAFTEALLEGVAGQAAPAGEQSVSTIDLISYVGRRVKALTENQQHPQVPFLQDFDTDAAIVSKP